MREVEGANSKAQGGNFLTGIGYPCSPLDYLPQEGMRSQDILSSKVLPIFCLTSFSPTDAATLSERQYNHTHD